jgi:hypothetical protein
MKKTKQQLLFLLVSIFILAAVLIMVSCTHYVQTSAYKPEEAPVVTTETTTRKAGRYEYKVVTKRWADDGLKKWNSTLYATCVQKDEALPSSDFVAVDYGYNGIGVDDIGFAKPHLVSDWEKVMHRAQAKREFSRVFYSKKKTKKG